MTPETVKAISRQQAEQVYAINNIQYPITTTDATPTIAVTIEMEDFEGGFIEVSVIASDTVNKFSGKSIVGVWKDGALTLDTPDYLHVADAIGASYSVVDSSDNPAVQVIGVAATDISWVVEVNKKTLITLSGA